MVNSGIPPRYNPFSQTAGKQLKALMLSDSGIKSDAPELSDFVQSAVDKSMMHIAAAVNRICRQEPAKRKELKPVMDAIDEMMGASYGWDKL